jgi:hypothetical protein
LIRKLRDKLSSHVGREGRAERLQQRVLSDFGRERRSKEDELDLDE